MGRIITTMNGYQMTAEGVFTYEANDEGKLVVLRAYWEFDKVAGTAKKV
ncbi:ketosteroid isomerase-like protein [Mycobacteroides abscessus]|nr:ketosteroid isomerase-like protein [Mycobacteroides abscessus]SKS40855.1 ketosteroid isomerase-like protein [Mycobacteroides abscessus subsp. abscessus]